MRLRRYFNAPGAPGDAPTLRMMDFDVTFPSPKNVDGSRGPPLGIGLEVDRFFDPQLTISEYAEQARAAGRLAA